MIRTSYLLFIYFLLDGVILSKQKPKSLDFIYTLFTQMGDN